VTDPGIWRRCKHSEKETRKAEKQEGVSKKKDDFGKEILKFMEDEKLINAQKKTQTSSMEMDVQSTISQIMEA